MTEAPPPPGDDSSTGSTPPPAAPTPPPPPAAPTPPPPPAAPTPPPSPPAAGGFPPPPPPPADGGYGAPPPGYGAPQGYGSPPPGYPGTGPAGGAYASWGLRVQAALLDYFAPSLVATVVYSVISTSLGLLLYLVAFGYGLYQAYLGGQTGQSFGKKTAGIRLLSEKTGQPIGGGLGIGRYLLHIVDGIPCYLGYLWPLWDAKKQTFADKILTTIVIKT